MPSKVCWVHELRQILIFTCFLRQINVIQWFLNQIEPEIEQQMLCLFPNFTRTSSKLKVIDNLKYLGHLISSKSGDNDTIMHEMRLIFTRTNVLISKFNEYNTDVKLCLFKAYCMCFYGMATCHLYNVTVMQRFEAAA